MKSKRAIFPIIIIFIICVVLSMSYYLVQFYSNMELVFNENQFPFYVIVFILILSVFSYTVYNEINNRKRDKEKNKKIEELTESIKGLEILLNK